MDIDFDEDALLEQLRPVVEARALAALEGWEAWPRKQDAPGYFFEKTENPRPTLDVDRIPGGFQLTITGPQVEFFEHGNGPGKIRPVRASKLSIRIAAGGYIELDEVNSYEGEQPWLKSVVAAFTDL